MSDSLQNTTVIEVIDDNGSQKPKKEKKKKRKLSKGGVLFFRILLLASICLMCFSGYKLYTGLKEYQQGDSTYKEIAGDTSLASVEDNKVNFEYLAGINPDVVGWLYMEDSSINYPVVQGVDNDYYLEHLFNGTTNHMGCIFVDYRNTPKFQDTNTAMYAHHMRNGSMFADLEKFKSQDYYEGHKTLYLQTPDGDYLIEPFAGCLLSGQEDFIQMKFDSDDAYFEYVNNFIANSTFKSDVELMAQDPIVSMVTCSYDFEDARYAVFAKITPVK